MASPNSLRVCTWNCFGAKRNKSFIHELCKKNLNIIALQETLLWPHDISMTDSIHENFNSFSISAMEVTENIVVGRPKGGLTFLWHKSLDNSVAIINYNSDRILGLQVSLGNCAILFINVYMPWECHSNADHYDLLLGQLQSIIHDSSADHICIIGDLNAHPNKPFYHELSRLCNNYSLTISDVSLLPPSTYTYLQNRNNSISTSWLDHCITSHHLHHAIEICQVRDDLGMTSDHLPLEITFNIPSLPPPLIQTYRPPKINWNFTDRLKTSHYTNLADAKLRHIPQPAEALLCNNPSCRIEQHRRDLSEFYSQIIKQLINSGKEIFNLRRDNTRNIPGWNDLVKDLHSHARNTFLIWRQNGSPREGHLALLMRQTRAQFKLALRHCKWNEDQMRANALSAKLNNHDYQQFWKNVQSLKPKSNKTAQRVGNAIGERAISEMWGDHFSSILNCIDDTQDKRKLAPILSNNLPTDHTAHISPSDVQMAIKQLPNNKAAGCDGLPAEAYKNAPAIIYELLSALFNACLFHKFLPESLLLVHIIPLIKNKLKDSADPGNYRPIAITTIASKILEFLLLSRLNPFLHTSDNQFGFKANHSTDACIYILKELINYYTSSNSPVYLCFVDVRKAFDRVNYTKLCLKLHDRGTPSYLISILYFWFTTQKFCIAWGNAISRSFGCSNGLRQGGVLSPHLFNVYMDDLSYKLNDLPIGCTVNNFTINNLCYADDMVLISPSAQGLQKLINTCTDYANAHDVIYNETKTQCMSILPNQLRGVNDPVITLGNHTLDFVNEFPYLGHIITRNQKDSVDIEHRRRKLCALGNMITRRFAFCNLDTKIQLFKSFCYSIYGCSLWANYTCENIRRLTVTHNDILRRMTGTPRHHSASNMFVHHNISNLKAILRKTVYSLEKRLESSNNTLIINTIQSEARLHSKIWSRWHQLHC